MYDMMNFRFKMIHKLVSKIFPVVSNDDEIDRKKVCFQKKKFITSQMIEDFPFHVEFNKKISIRGFFLFFFV